LHHREIAARGATARQQEHQRTDDGKKMPGLEVRFHAAIEKYFASEAK
jgi:hypothetical protein